MPVGSLRQKASPLLVGFVFGCIIVTIGLLYVMTKAEALGDNLVSTKNNEVQNY